MTIILDTPINITNKGKIIEVSVINVSLPTVQYYNLYVAVKEVTLKAMFSLKDTLGDSANTEDDGLEDAILPLDLFLSSGTVMDLSKAVNSYLCRCATFDDDIQLNEKHIKKLSISDYNNILERVSYFLFEN